MLDHTAEGGDSRKTVSRRGIARAKIYAALSMIEEAQVLLSRATAEICPVIGVIKNYDQLGTLYLKVKQAWHKLNRRADDSTIRLDHEPTPNCRCGCADTLTNATKTVPKC